MLLHCSAVKFYQFKASIIKGRYYPFLFIIINFLLSSIIFCNISKAFLLGVCNIFSKH